MRTKRVKLFALVVACLLAVCAVIVAACDFTFRSKELEKITLDTSNAKTTFYVDEGLYWTSEGLQVTAYYDDGSTAVIESGYYVREASLSAVGEEQVRVIYGTAEAYYTVTVAQVDHLRLDTSAVDKTFRQGDEFNSEGLKVYAVYTNGDEVLLSGGYEVSADLNTAGATQAVVTYSAEVFNEMGGGTYYKTFKATYTVSVLAQNLKGIVIEKAPEKDHYYVGDALETEGLVVYGVFEGQGNLPLGDVEFTFTAPGLTDGKFTQDGTITVTVHYDEYTATFDVTVEKVVPVSLALDTGKVQKEFFVGDAFSYEGLVVTASYNSGKSATVTPTKVEGSTAVAGDAITVTVFYTEGDVTVTETYTIKVTAVVLEEIEIKSKPEKLTYYVGDDFSAEGLVITAKYNNGKTKELSLGTAGLTVSTPDMGTTGTKPVTVTYTENGVNATVDFEITVLQALKAELTLGATKANTYVGREVEIPTVTAHYNGAEEKILANYTVTVQKEGGEAEAWESGYTYRSAGKYTVTFTYSEELIAGRKLTATASYEVTVEDVKLVSIEADATALADIVFERTGEYDFTGLVITAKYNDGSEKNIRLDDGNLKLVPGDITDTDDTHTRIIHVTYTEADVEQSTNFTVNVKTNVTLVNITVNHDNAAKSFFVGDEFTYELTVTEHYSDNSTNDLPEGQDGYLVKLFLGETEASLTEGKFAAGGTYTVKVFVGEEMVGSYEISVAVIEVLTENAILVFYVGETYTHAGLSIVEHKITGNETFTGSGVFDIFDGGRNITNNYVFTAEDATRGTIQLGVNRAGNYGYYTIEVKELSEATLKDITVTVPESLKIFTEGDELDYAGITVNAVYTGEKNATESREFSLAVTGFTAQADNLDAEGKLTVDSTTVTVSYENKTTTYEITVNAKQTAALSRIEVDDAAAKTEFETGESFTTEGLVVKAFYGESDTDGRRVNNYTYELWLDGAKVELTDGRFEKEGTYTVKISFTDGDITAKAEYTVQVYFVGLKVSVEKTYVVGDTFETSDLYVLYSSKSGTDEVTPHAVWINNLGIYGPYEAPISDYKFETAGNYIIWVQYNIPGGSVTGYIEITVEDAPVINGYEIEYGNKTTTNANAGTWFYFADTTAESNPVKVDVKTRTYEDGVITFEVENVEDPGTKGIFLRYQPKFDIGTKYLVTLTVNISAPVRLAMGIDSNARYFSFGGGGNSGDAERAINEDITLTWPNSDPNATITQPVVDANNPFQLRLTKVNGSVKLVVKDIKIEENAYYLEKKTNGQVEAARGVWAYNETDGTAGSYSLVEKPKFSNGVLTMSYNSMAEGSVGAQLRYQPDWEAGTQYTVSFTVRFSAAGTLGYRINSKNQYIFTGGNGEPDFTAGEERTITYDDVIVASSPFMLEVRAADRNAPITVTVTNVTFTEKQQGTIKRAYGHAMDPGILAIWFETEGFEKSDMEGALLVINNEVSQTKPYEVNTTPVAGQYQLKFHVDTLQGSPEGKEYKLQLQLNGEIYELAQEAVSGRNELNGTIYELSFADGHLVLTVTTEGSAEEQPDYTLAGSGENNTTQGWFYYSNGPTLSGKHYSSDDRLEVEFSNNTGVWWHLQLFYNDASLEIGQKYTISFDIYSSAAGKINFYGDNGINKTLQAGENHFEIEWTLVVNKANLSIYMGWSDGTLDLEAANLTISNLKFTKIAKAPLVPTTPMDPPEYLGDELTVGENATLANDTWHSREDAKSNTDNWNIWWVGQDGWNGCGTKLTSINSSLQGGVLTVEYSGGSVGFSVQLYFNNSALVEGNDYFLSFKVKASAPCVIGIHGQSYILGEGENTVTVVFTHTAELCAFDVQLPGCNSADHLNEIAESLKFEISDVSWQEVLEKTEFIETAAKLEADADAGKVYFVLSGTYTGYSESALRAILEEIFFSFKRNGFNGGDWGGPWDEYEDLVRTVEVGGNTWSIKFDVTALEYFGGTNLYTAYFRAAAPGGDNKGLDLKLENAEDGQSVVLNGKKYTLVNKFGDNENANVSWGCIALEVSQKSSVSFGEVTLDSSRDTSKVYLVLPVTAENYLADDWKTAAIYGDAGNPISVSFVEAAEGQDNTWNLYFDVTDFRGELYLHLSVRGAKYNNTDDNVTRQSNPYVERKTDGFIYKVWFNPIWGDWGMPVLEVVETALKEPVKVGLETNEENTRVYYVVYVRLDSTDIISSISFGDIDNENSDKGKQMFNVEKYEIVDGNLYKLYFDVTDVNVNEWVWPHLYFNREGWDDDKGDINVAGSGSVTVNGRVYEIQMESGMPTLKNWNV